MNKTEDDLKWIFLEIESDRDNTTLPLDKEYNDLYWKWKDAVAVNEIAQTKLKKYETNMNADIPDVMIELKEMKNEMQCWMKWNGEWNVMKWEGMLTEIKWWMRWNSMKWKEMRG